MERNDEDVIAVIANLQLSRSSDANGLSFSKAPGGVTLWVEVCCGQKYAAGRGTLQAEVRGMGMLQRKIRCHTASGSTQQAEIHSKQRYAASGCTLEGKVQGEPRYAASKDGNKGMLRAEIRCNEKYGQAKVC